MKSMKFQTTKTAVILALCALALAGRSHAENRHGASVRILFTNDLHSNYLPFRDVRNKRETLSGGYARLSGLIKRERLSGPACTLALDAGDSSMGTLFHTLFAEDGTDLGMLGMMGYDAVTFGNHEFDFRCGGLASMLRSAKKNHAVLPAVVFSNAVFSDDGKGDRSLREAFASHPVREYAVFEKNGIRTGVFGVMGKEAGIDTPYAKPLSFADPVETADRVAEILRKKEKADLVVCLSHTGIDPSGNAEDDRYIAENARGIDVIISGHAHSATPSPVMAGKTIIVSSGCYGADLGELDMERSGSGFRLKSFRLLPVDASAPVDAAVEERISSMKGLVAARYLSKFGLGFDQVLAESGFDMGPIREAYEKLGRSPVGDMVTDSFRHAVRTAEGKMHEPVSLAVAPLGHIRDTVMKGRIAVSDAFRILSIGMGEDGSPGYPLVAFYLSGGEIRNLLEVEASIAPYKKDAHLQISGARFTYNPHRMIFDRITSVMIDAGNGIMAPIEDSKLYRVCMNLFNARMFERVGDLSHGLITMEPKDRDGRPLASLESAIVRAGGGELKEWMALAQFMKSFRDRDGNGIPDVPEKYDGREERSSSEPSWNPVSLLAGGGPLTMAAAHIFAGSASLAGVMLFRLAKRRRYRSIPGRQQPGGVIVKNHPL
jgi:2',3'-cyclic-nucleotide 2'-phosphodiesterase (5'-nucleotidase family)